MLVYRPLSALIALVMMLGALWGVLRGRRRMGDLHQMLGAVPAGQSTIWVHAASVGEVTAARPVIARLAQDHPVVVTVTTVTARKTVQDWAIDGLIATLAPLDLGWTTRRVLRRAGVRVLIVVENEIWPARMHACHQAGVPVAIINARMSDRTARLWGRFRGLAETVIRPIALIVPQDQESGTRFQALAARSEAIRPGCDLKSLYQPVTRPLPADLAGINRTQTVLAAATHPGEEPIVLEAFAQARARNPQLQLIIAPRHPDRRAEIADLIAGAGFAPTMRSQGAPFSGAVYLADTIGEMDLWYRVSRAAFIGGSLVPKGGHTPYEPAAYGCAVITGPHVENFQTPYRRLLAAGQATEVFDAASLAAAFLSPPPPPQKHGQDHDTILAPIVADLQHLLADNLRHADA